MHLEFFHRYSSLSFALQIVTSDHSDLISSCESLSAVTFSPFSFVSYPKSPPTILPITDPFSNHSSIPQKLQEEVSLQLIVVPYPPSVATSSSQESLFKPSVSCSSREFTSLSESDGELTPRNVAAIYHAYVCVFAQPSRKEDPLVWNSKGWKPLYYCLGWTCIMFLIRSIYRTIELSQGYLGYLNTHEVSTTEKN